jgi:hypothetical protein
MTKDIYPQGLGSSGKSIWLAMTELAELEPWEIVMLMEACRVADRLDALSEALAGATLTVTNRHGDEVASPYLVESRQQAAIYTRLIASLRVPDTSTGKQPQHRGAARGNYGPRALLSVS